MWTRLLIRIRHGFQYLIDGLEVLGAWVNEIPLLLITALAVIAVILALVAAQGVS